MWWRNQEGRFEIAVHNFLKEFNDSSAAMTRAIGDVVCQSLGVIAEPEINVFNISNDDEFILLCSDGVREFLSNVAVIGMVSSNMAKSVE